MLPEGVFHVHLKTSFKVPAGNGSRIVPAGAVFRGDVKELPEWLIPEIESNSSHIEVTKLAMKGAPSAPKAEETKMKKSSKKLQRPSLKK
jgi:hypothetical protein